jgi:5S rRNA maturation endonuclease (ribonuclease M5)
VHQSIQNSTPFSVLLVELKATLIQSLCNTKELISVRLSHAQKQSLDKAAKAYAQDIHLAAEYLESRGLSLEDAKNAFLGVVNNPLPGHEQFRGRLAIPYITPTGVVDIRFRALGPQEPKYLGLPGAKTRMFNTNSILTAIDRIAICEGEIDALTLSYKVGIPAVGVPGANAWKPHYKRLLQDFDTIYVFSDGDQAGQDFARHLARELNGIVNLTMPEGEDVNSMYLANGKEYFLEKVRV